jgi:16S rRNA (uracil1498-N3)-methyltransferase
MRRHRFFVAPERLVADPVRLDGDLAHQLSRVLRLSRGDEIELLDNTGTAWVTRLDEVSPRLCLATRLRAYRPATEPRIPMVLYQGLPKGQKLDLVLQKATELGASRLVPVTTARSTPVDRAEGARTTRWRRILQEAAEQSGRARIPELGPTLTLSEALADVRPDDLSLIGDIDGDARPIHAALDAGPREPACVRLFVGPEGGFEPEEVREARARGVVSVSLGPRTLRTETAGLVLLAVVGYALGEMDAAAGQNDG